MSTDGHVYVWCRQRRQTAAAIDMTQGTLLADESLFPSQIPPKCTARVYVCITLIVGRTRLDIDPEIVSLYCALNFVLRDRVRKRENGPLAPSWRFSVGTHRSIYTQMH